MSTTNDLSIQSQVSDNGGENGNTTITIFSTTDTVGERTHNDKRESKDSGLFTISNVVFTSPVLDGDNVNNNQLLENEKSKKSLISSACLSVSHQLGTTNKKKEVSIKSQIVDSSNRKLPSSQNCSSNTSGTLPTLLKPPPSGHVHLSLTRLPSGSTSEAVKKEKKKRKGHSGGPLKSLTRMEILTIACLALGNLCLGTLYALLAPFFPHEAEKKGVSPSLYGLVFGIFEFGQFIFAPAAGYLVPHTSPKFTLTIGLFITAWCTVVFGSLQWCPGGMTYFWLAFILRFVSSTGAAAYFTASFTLIATEFSDRISSLFALTEVCFGVGMIVGPSVGGVLFEAGGFSLPFFVTGSVCFFAAGFSLFALKTPKEEHSSSSSKVSVFTLTTNLPVMMNILISFTTFINVGFNDATLEHHLRDFLSLTPTAIGGMFLVSGVVYAATTQGWGMLIQKYGRAHLFVVIGYALAALSFTLCGPAYPLPKAPTLGLVIVAQLLYGLSMGPQLVGSFTQALQLTIDSGLPDEISTSAAVSSLYQSSCALGAAVGPAVGGFLMDSWGYEKASTVLVALQISMIVILMVYNWTKRSSCCGGKAKGEGKERQPSVTSSLSRRSSEGEHSGNCNATTTTYVSNTQQAIQL